MLARVFFCDGYLLMDLWRLKSREKEGLGGRESQGEGTLPMAWHFGRCWQRRAIPRSSREPYREAFIGKEGRGKEGRGIKNVDRLRRELDKICWCIQHFSLYTKLNLLLKLFFSAMNPTA